MKENNQQNDIKTNIHWYPGHMTKAKRQMQESIKLIDVIIELVDARVPLASRNPDIDELGKNKPRIIIMNKADMASDNENTKWKKYFEEKGFHVILTNAKTGQGVKSLKNQITEVCKEKIERDKRRGIKNRPIRGMVCGIPNVGKSTFINSVVGKSTAKTGNKPGVTRGNQWIKLNNQVELLDTPGILWPKFEDPKVGILLALCGGIKEDVLNVTELACYGITILSKQNSKILDLKYNINTVDILPNYDIINQSEILTFGEIVLDKIAESRKMLLKGGLHDINKAALMFLDDIRNAKFGGITFEIVEEINEE
ncbi:MAG: ribosome biogenesis GTPase YlqF [Lachnospiraceae bacterium]|jgi:ribosome biogenesis GTPase A|nr:ribosome biogenesis GTPase YlqF [Lachnospiraceae bacterium]